MKEQEPPLLTALPFVIEGSDTIYPLAVLDKYEQFKHRLFNNKCWDVEYAILRLKDPISPFTLQKAGTTEVLMPLNEASLRGLKSVTMALYDDLVELKAKDLADEALEEFRRA